MAERSQGLRRQRRPARRSPCYGPHLQAQHDDIGARRRLTNTAGAAEAGAEIRASTPRGSRRRGPLRRASLRADAYEAMDGADSVVCSRKWNEFRALDLERIKR